MPGTIDALAERLAEELLPELCTADGEHEPLTGSENIATRRDGSVINKVDLQETIKKALEEAGYNDTWDEDTISAFKQSDSYDSIKRKARNPRVKKAPALDPDEDDDVLPSTSDDSDPESEEEEIETPADTAQAVTALEQAPEASPSQTAAEPSKPTWEQILEELTSTLLPFFETNSITEANLKSAIARNLEEFYGGQPTDIPTEDLITTLTEIGIEKLQQSPASLAATAAEPAQSNPSQSPETQRNSEQVPQTTQRALEFLQTVKQKLLHELDIPLKTEDTASRDRLLEQLILTKFTSDPAAFRNGTDAFIATHGNNILAIMNKNTRTINTAIKALATTVLQSYLKEADEYTIHGDGRIRLEDGGIISEDIIIKAILRLDVMATDLSTIAWNESTPDSLANRIIDRALEKEEKPAKTIITNIITKLQGPPIAAKDRVKAWIKKMAKQPKSSPLRNSVLAVKAPELGISKNPVEAAADRLLRPLLEQNHCSREQIREFLEDHSDHSYLCPIPLADGRRISRHHLFQVIGELFLSYRPNKKSASFDDFVTQQCDKIINRASLQTNAEISLRLRRSPITASWQQFVSLITAANWEAVNDTSTSPAVDKFRIPLVVLSLKLQPNPSLCFALSRCCEEKEGLWTTEKLTATLKEWLKINFDLLPEADRISFARAKIWIDSVSILAGNPYNWHFAFRAPRYSEGEIWKRELQKACSLLSYCIMGNQEGADICIRKGPPSTTLGTLPELTTKTAIANRLTFQAWLDEIMQHRMRYLESDFQGKYAQGSRPTKEQFRIELLTALRKSYGPCYNMESDRLRLTGWFKETYAEVTRRAFALANGRASTRAKSTAGIVTQVSQNPTTGLEFLQTVKAQLLPFVAITEHHSLERHILPWFQRDSNALKNGVAEFIKKYGNEIVFRVKLESEHQTSQAAAVTTDTAPDLLTKLAEDIFRAYLANYLHDPVMISQAVEIGEIYFEADKTRLKKQSIRPAILNLCRELNISTERWGQSQWEAFANQHAEQITTKVFELSNTTNKNAINTLGNTNMPTAAARSTGAFPTLGVDDITSALLSTPATVRPGSGSIDPYTEIEIEDPKEVKFSDWLENAAIEREGWAQSDWEGEDACPALPNSPEFAFAISHVFKKNGWVSYENGLYDKKQLELWHKESHEAVRKIAFLITTYLAYTLFTEHQETFKISAIVEVILQTLRNHTELPILDWDEDLWLTLPFQDDFMVAFEAMKQKPEAQNIRKRPAAEDERKRNAANSTAGMLSSLGSDNSMPQSPTGSTQFAVIHATGNGDDPLGSGAEVTEAALEDRSRRIGNHKGASDS